MMKIDVVIPWVDGNDPVLNAKRQQYGESKFFKMEDVAADTRFANDGEIYWCVASINRFAPWVNRIYIVTDGQDPDMIPFLEKYFPDGCIPVEIVDHKEIFRGYEQYLPVFNSVSIESIIWRIPGLSDRFILFNDDVFLTSETRPEDFFTVNGVVAPATWTCLPWRRLKHFFLKKKNGRKPYTTIWNAAQAARLLGEKWRFLKMEHTPKAAFKNLYEELYDAEPELLIRNIRHRFRNNEQYSLIEYQWLSLYRQGKARIVSPKDCLFYMKPKNKPDYVRKKLEKLDRKEYKYCCFNSLDCAKPEERALAADWLNKKMGL